MTAASGPESAESFKIAGNNALQAGDPSTAISLYSDGLQLNPSHGPLLLKRSLARLKLGHHRGAAEDATRALAGNLVVASRIKALYRRALALYGLEDWQGSKESLERALSLDAGNAEAVSRLDSCSRRMQEARSGTYHWPGLWASSLKDFRVEVADFVGSIELVDVPGKGRGLVASEDLSAGTLVMLVKPFAVVLSSDIRSPSSRFEDPAFEALESPTQRALGVAIHERVQLDPALSVPLEHLYAGPDFSIPPLFDLKEVCAPYPSRPAPSSPSSALSPSRIAAAITHNAFTARRLGPALEPSPDDSASCPPSGLYLLPSLLNHDCVGTTSRSFIGHAMAIRTRVDIRKGDELTQSYVGGMEFDLRETVLEKHTAWCVCRLCKNDRKETADQRMRRSALVHKITSLSHSSEPSPPAISRLIDEISSLYHPTHDVALRFDLHPALHTLADVYSMLAFSSPSTPLAQRAALARLAIATEIKALASCGVVAIVDSSLPSRAASQQQRLAIEMVPPMGREEGCAGSCLAIASALVEMGDAKGAGRWVRSARWIDGIFVGGGKALFDARWKGAMEMYGLVG